MKESTLRDILTSYEQKEINLNVIYKKEKRKFTLEYLKLNK